MYDNLRVGDRVMHRGTGRTGVVKNLTASPGWEDQAQIKWDDTGRVDMDLLDWPSTGQLIRE